ncbi:MAG TPA: hypothetical protein VFC60_01500 [Tissierellaceae bacterium]|nr:hypothetical protein [Tissierellaceae bacterium]
MKFFKRVSFWTTLFAIIICIYNYLGFDKWNVIIYLLSPPSWLLDSWVTANYPYPSVQSLIIIYSTTILFWLLLGVLIDKIIRKKTI